MMIFEEQQRFRQKWMYLLYVMLFLLIAWFVYASVQQIIFNIQFGDKPAPDILLLFITLFLVAVLVLLYAIKFETIITDESVSFRFSPFQQHYRKISWIEIDKAEVIHYGFAGYGIRFTGQGTIYNIAGQKGLRLQLKNGKKIILGTQKPDELADFLQKLNRRH